METPTRQYVAVEFRPGDVRTYTYHNDGEPVAIGDRVVISTKKGTSTVTVVALPTEKPKFDTKAIVGLVGIVPPLTTPAPTGEQL